MRPSHAIVERRHAPRSRDMRCCPSADASRKERATAISRNELASPRQRPRTMHEYNRTIGRECPRPHSRKCMSRHFQNCRYPTPGRNSFRHTLHRGTLQRQTHGRHRAMPLYSRGNIRLRHRNGRIASPRRSAGVQRQPAPHPLGCHAGPARKGRATHYSHESSGESYAALTCAFL